MEKRHTVVADIHKDQIKLFSYIDFETNSDCNRVCPTCIRNSHPNKKKIALLVVESRPLLAYISFNTWL